MLSQTKSSLWKRFAAIAQPYFFPAIPGAGRYTLLLMIMLMIFLFGVLFVFVAGIILAGNHFAPSLTAKIASGLTELVMDLLHSGSGLLVVAALTVPAMVFAGFRRHLKVRRQA